MTIKEKIKNLVFFDLVAKLKDILGNFSTKFDSLTGRVSTLESNSGSGGSQDLQQTLDIGANAYYDDDTNFITILEGNPYDREISMSTNDGSNLRTAFSLNPTNTALYGERIDLIKNAEIRIDNGVIFLTQIFGEAQTIVSFEEPLASNVEVRFPSKLPGIYTIATLEDIEALKNEQGQVKVNYTGLSTVGFVAETLKTLDINGATHTIVSSPTTKFPFSTPNTYAGFFDSARGSSPTGRLIENPVDGQVHTWRFQISYANKGAGNNGSLDLILTNPVSGFQYVMPFTLPSGRTAGTLNNVAITIADEASIPAPNGYILQCRTSFSDANLTIDSISITRISQAVENF